MPITFAQFLEMQRRVEPKRKTTTHEGEKSEMPLHEKIIKWCNDQIPRVKYIRARSDCASTIQLGAQDFTLFLPNGRTLCVECKSATGKLSPDQLIWAKEMSMLGHTVHVVRNMEEFYDKCKTVDGSK